MQNSNKNNKAVKALSFGEGLGEVAVKAPFDSLGALGGTWRAEGQCTCGGTLTVKYEYIADRSIKLRIKPHKKRFNLYARRWGEWDKPLAALEQVLAAHGLMSK